MIGILVIAVIGIVLIVFVLFTKKEGKETILGGKKWTTGDLKESSTQPFEPVSVVTDKTEPTLPSTLGIVSPELESEYPGATKYLQLVDPRTELTPAGEAVKQRLHEAQLDYAAGRISMEEYYKKVEYYGFPGR